MIICQFLEYCSGRRYIPDMNNLFEYLVWRGDISFTQLGPVNADYAVFCSLSYIPFDGILADTVKDGYIPLAEAAGRVLKIMEKKDSGRRYHLPEDEQLLRSIIGTNRFSELKAGHYVNIFNPEKQEQFSAVTFLLPGGDVVAAFRGTDGSIIGWKEDFNMGFMDELPSQKEAVGYINSLAQNHQGNIYLCGHSKGGNLAMYGAAFAQKELQEKIAAVRSLDGPGFKHRTTERRGFLRMADRMESFMPQSSMVGVLLEHKGENKVIHSFAKGTKQHDIYTWSIMGGDFTEEKSLSESGIRISKAINNWMKDMSDEKRMKLTDGIFEIVVATKAETLEELFEPKNIFAVRKNLGKMDDETKELIAETGRIIRASLKKKA